MDFFGVLFKAGEIQDGYFSSDAIRNGRLHGRWISPESTANPRMKITSLFLTTPHLVKREQG